jgi:menaquinol-cytochrome c reductase cytochrome b/c subunit
MDKSKEFKTEETADAQEVSRRIAFIKNRDSAKVEKEEADMVMTVPNLVIKEIIAFEVMVIVLAIISLFFNAPLEWIANPDHTPNPAKAPWYFLGLQELLHYFPPVVAGVLLPALAVIALIVIPYFKINVKREPLWESNAQRKFITLSIFIILLGIFLIAFKVYDMLMPSLIIYTLMIIPYFSEKNSRMIELLRVHSLAWWIMTWFVVIVVVLTIIGTFFRGPEWSWTWPWVKIY